MDLNERIAQFENMAAADAENEMAHFSLGGAYAQAERHEDAAAAYLRAIDLVPDLSKAYQLAAESLIKMREDDRAAQLLAEGYDIAVRNGDVMPRDAMALLLKELGHPVPEIAGGPDTEIPEGAFVCQKSGRAGTQMDAPPFKGPIGAWIQANISRETFNEWIAQGTKVINELRLDLCDDNDAKTYDTYMHEFLGITDEVLATLAKA